MNKIISIFTIFFSLIFAQISSVHLMEIVYNKAGDIEAKNPEVLQTYYDQLGGVPRNYLINSKTDFDLYINLLVPASSNYNGRYSAKIFSVKDGTEEEVAFIDGQTKFEWQEFYDPSIRDYYFKGPETEKKLPAGNYKITVFSYENRNKYVLTIGKNQEFSWLNLVRAYRILPVLKTEFFKTSVLQFFLTPFGLVLIGAVLILLLIFALFIFIGFFIEKIKNRKTRVMLLTSSGMQGSKQEILNILPKPAYDVRVAHIITASKSEADKTYLEKDRELMREAHFNIKDIDIEGKNKTQLMAELKDMDIIYVQGGNTFYLLKQIRMTGFDKVVKKLIKKGVIYIGVSAGSIVAGKTIITAGWKNTDKNTVKIKNLKGLRLVPFNIFVHYKPEYDEIIRKEQKKSWHKLKILTDTQAILVLNREITLLGTGEEVVY
ncbi:MAG: Type 1 glutamine amidotransferase-like domain-containing protein [Patescibacteria group bacterium]